MDPRGWALPAPASPRSCDELARPAGTACRFPHCLSTESKRGAVTPFRHSAPCPSPAPCRGDVGPTASPTPRAKPGGGCSLRVLIYFTHKHFLSTSEGLCLAWAHSGGPSGLDLGSGVGSRLCHLAGPYLSCVMIMMENLRLRPGNY